ncbi:MAG TPA: VWA domain-containing protein [Pyrinomonadaceae bacterium]
MLLGVSVFSQTQDGRPRRAQQQPSPSPAQTPRKQGGQPEPGEPPAMPQKRATPSPSPSPSPGGEEIDPNDVVKVSTDLVTLNVRVVDRGNRPINDIRQEEFRVFEDGVPQPVEFFSKEEVPIAYGLVLDNSLSMRTQLERVIEAGKAIVNSNRPGDETFVVRFVDNEKIDVRQDFTANKTSLMETLDDLYVEGGQTAVIDAVYLSAEHLAQYKKGDDLADRRRRALIVVTDGEDKASFYKQEQLFQSLREEDVQIYVIGFVNELDAEGGGLIRKSPKEKAVKLIERLAKDTGGRAFFPSSVAELPEIASQITRDLRTQYVISYNPTNKAKDGTFRTIRVAVADKPGTEHRIALTRSGRVASPQGRPAPNAPRQPAARTGGNSTQPPARPALTAPKSP